MQPWWRAVQGLLRGAGTLHPRDVLGQLVDPRHLDASRGKFKQTGSDFQGVRWLAPFSALTFLRPDVLQDGVVDAIVPEAHSRGNSGLASWGAMVGFCVMMSLDVAL